MTFPTNNLAYTQATGSAPITVPVFRIKDPGEGDVNYKISQLWINTQTNAIWVLQQLNTFGGSQIAQWRAIGPIVLMDREPTTADYLYPLGQSWLDTDTQNYWILVEVVDQVATWDNLSEGGGTGILSLSDGSGTKTFPTVGGNIQLSNGNNITTTAGTNEITIDVTGTTQYNVQVGNASGSLTSIAPSPTEGVPLISQGSSDNPEFGTALVPGGGTGRTMFMPYSPVCGGITATGNLEQASMGMSNAGYVLTSNGLAALPTWEPAAGSGDVETLTGNSGGPIGPSAGNIDTVGTGSITIIGAGNTLTTQLTGLTDHSVLVGAGTPTVTNVGPDANIGIPLISQGLLQDPVFGTAVVGGGGTGSTMFTPYAPVCAGTTPTGVMKSADSGFTNVGYVLTSTGGASLPTWQPATSDGDIATLTGNTGGPISPVDGNINTLGTGSITISGSGNTLTTQLTGLTEHSILVGAGTATITNVGPVGSTGIPLISQGGSTDPNFGTALVPGGGTGGTTFPAFAPICAGTTDTGNFQAADTGISNTGYVLTSTGASSLPTWQEGSGSSGVQTLTGNTGGPISPVSGNINTIGTGSLTVSGTGNTLTAALTGLNDHAVLVGAGTATVTNVGPNSAIGIPFISGGSSSDPSFGTALVPGGGTGSVTFNPYSPVCAGTTATGSFQSASTGQTNSGYVLTSTGGSSLPTWQLPHSGTFSIVNRVFTSSGTYNPTANMTYCSIQCVGGGGAGGGAQSTTPLTNSIGGGGGAGEYAVGLFSAISIGISQTIIIAPGGIPLSGGTGGYGGTTSVGALISAFGGEGGLAISVTGTLNTARYVSGGVGGTGGSGGDYRVAGSNGGIGIIIPTILYYVPGSGSGSLLGSTIESVGSNISGANGVRYGSGGSGACNAVNQVGRPGGSGSSGVVIITEYISSS